MNEELFWLRQEDVVRDDELFLHADTPVGRGSLSTGTQRRLLKERHRRLLCRIAELQKSEIETFHADMAQRVDPVLLPPSWEGVFEVMEGRDYLEARKQEIINIISCTTPPKDEDEEMKMSKEPNDDIQASRYKKELEVLYNTGFEKLMGRHEQLLEEVRRDYIEDLMQTQKWPREPPTSAKTNVTTVPFSSSSHSLNSKHTFTPSVPPSRSPTSSPPIALEQTTLASRLPSSSRNPQLHHQQQLQQQEQRLQKPEQQTQNLELNPSSFQETRPTFPASTAHRPPAIPQGTPSKRGISEAFPLDQMKKPKSILKRLPRPVTEEGVITVVANYQGKGARVLRKVGDNIQMLGYPNEFENALYKIATTGGKPTSIKLQDIAGELYFTKVESGEVIGRVSTIAPLVRDFFLESA